MAGGHRQPKTTSVSAASIFTIKKCERWKRTFREYPDGYESTTRSARAPRRRVDLSLPHGRARTRSVGACGIRDARVSPNAMPVDSSESVGDASRKQKIQTTARSGIAPQSGWREACDHARRAGDDLEGLSDRLFASPGARSNDPARARVPRATPNAGHRPHVRLLLFLALALTTRKVLFHRPRRSPTLPPPQTPTPPSAEGPSSAPFAFTARRAPPPRTADTTSPLTCAPRFAPSHPSTTRKPAATYPSTATRATLFKRFQPSARFDPHPFPDSSTSRTLVDDPRSNPRT